MPTTAELREMLAASEAADRENAAAAAASTLVADRIGALVAEAAALSTAAGLSGLTAPDMSAVLAAAISRATPAAPDALAAVIDPDPVQNDGPTRRTRRRVERDWSKVTDGVILSATLAGNTGRVRVNVRPDGTGATFTATTGNRGTFPTASRAVQSACGDPAGAGRKGEATVNGFLALTFPDGSSLADVTAV